MSAIRRSFDRLQKQWAKSKFSINLDLLPYFSAVVDEGFALLRTAKRVSIHSSVDGKKYVFYSLNGRTSRVINVSRFGSISHAKVLVRKFFKALKKQQFQESSEVLTNGCYAATIAVCAGFDLTAPKKKGKDDDMANHNENDGSNNKTPGTFFEHLIAFVYAIKLQVSRTKKLPIPDLNINGELVDASSSTGLPVDAVFIRGNGRPGVHLSVKLSTRERIAETYLHQRVLDGAYGMERFQGHLVVMSETNRALIKKTNTATVAENCEPHQLVAFQRFVARLHRIYYLDPPAKYFSLADKSPKIIVKQLGDFLRDDGLEDGVNSSEQKEPS